MEFNGPAFTCCCPALGSVLMSGVPRGTRFSLFFAIKESGFLRLKQKGPLENVASLLGYPFARALPLPGLRAMRSLSKI